MGSKIKLGKTATSRTRAKKKEPELNASTVYLKSELTKKNQGFTEYLLSKGYSSKTAYNYLSDFTCFKIWTQAENIPLEAVSYNDVLHYIQCKRKDVEQGTIKGISNSIRHYYNYLVFTGAIKENPITTITIKGIRRKKLYDILSKQELENLYHSYQIKTDEKNKNQNWYKASVFNTKRNKIIVGLLTYQGLTAVELFRITVKDVALREGKIFICGTRKSNEREMKLESAQILDLMEYILKTRPEMLLETKKNSELLLISSGGSHHIKNGLQKLTSQLKKINQKIVSLKHIRTSVITHWLKQYNLRQVQYMAGHRYVTSTESYQMNDLDDLLEDITKFHPIG